MPEDYTSIALEVEQALRSIGDISEPDGHPAVIRQADPDAEPDPDTPWIPPTGYTYHEVRVLISDQELRDINGTLIGQTKRTVIISGAAGVVPHDDDTIVLGMTEAQVVAAGDANVAWKEIETVRPLAPAGVTVLYDLTLVA